MTKTAADIIRELQPLAQPAFRRLCAYLKHAHEEGKTNSLFVPYEGYRSPLRQIELLNERPVVTKAGPWQSAHQYGLAVDFAVSQRGGVLSWDEKHDWYFLQRAAYEHDLLRPLAWDMGHIVHPSWNGLQAYLADSYELWTKLTAHNDNATSGS